MTTEDKIEIGIAVTIGFIGSFLYMGAWRDLLAAFILSLFSFLGLIGILTFRRQLRKKMITVSVVSFVVMGVGALVLPLFERLSSMR